MINFEKKKAGLTIHLVLALILTLMTVSTAVILNNMHKSMAVPTSTILKTDYQMESAIVMQMQKIKNDKSGNSKSFSFSREVSPGYHLSLSSEQISQSVWSFNVRVTGPSFSRNLRAQASLEYPDRITYLKN